MFVILGLGKSGKAAAALLLQQGKSVLGLDTRFPQTDLEIALLQERGMQYASDQSLLDWSEVELFVVSPGIAPTHPLYAQAIVGKKPIMSEVALAFSCLQQPMIAVTGTNGKTTVVSLIEHVLNACGISAIALGNNGKPVSTYALQKKEERILVIELSSFQLELLNGPLFDAGVILNITPDHLDRYASLEEYAQAKARMQYCMKEGAPLFVNANIPFSFSQKVRYFSSADENVEAAWLLCRHFGITHESFEHALSSFSKLPHRIAFVAERDGVKYFNDSKGTNVGAVIRAVHAMSGPVILLAGGYDKGASFRLWAEACAGKIKRIIVFGSAREKILCELAGQFEMEQFDALSSALNRARTCAQPGDCILLSPGCASTDQFRDYAHRGEIFEKLVLEKL